MCIRDSIKGVLVDIGYGLCEKPEDADLILFNTCAVREHAEQRVFGNVGALKGLKEKKPGLIIGLCGCMANQKHVVEDVYKRQRGHKLGRIIREGAATPNTGVPGVIGGYAAERVLHSSAQGIFRDLHAIGDFVEAGEAIAKVETPAGEEVLVKTQIAGILRGLLREMCIRDSS